MPPPAGAHLRQIYNTSKYEFLVIITAVLGHDDRRIHRITETQCKPKTRHHPIWDLTIAGPPQCPVWCWLVTVPTDPFSTFTSPTDPFLSEWAKCQPGNNQNGRTVLPITNLMADSELGSPVSYSRFVVTICLSHLVSDIFAHDRQTDKWTTRTITTAGPHIVAGQLKIIPASICMSIVHVS